MDSSKAILILGLLAVVLVISSEVSARELTETSSDAKKEVVVKTNEVNDAKYGGGGNYHNGGGNYHNGGGHYYGGGSHGGGGSHHGGGGCHYYCHGHCCSYAEFVAVQSEEKNNEVNDAKYGGGGNYHNGGGNYHNGGGNYHNGGGHYYGGGSHGGGGSHHGGGGCRYYCHGHCCSHAEFVAVQAEEKTQN